jgi:hypothetical protein
VCIKGPAKRDYISDLKKLRYASSAGRSAVALRQATGYGGTSRESLVPPQAGAQDGVLKPLLECLNTGFGKMRSALFDIATLESDNEYFEFRMHPEPSAAAASVD